MKLFRLVHLQESGKFSYALSMRRNRNQLVSASLVFGPVRLPFDPNLNLLTLSRRELAICSHRAFCNVRGSLGLFFVVTDRSVDFHGGSHYLLVIWRSVIASPIGGNTQGFKPCERPQELIVFLMCGLDLSYIFRENLRPSLAQNQCCRHQVLQLFDC